MLDLHFALSVSARAGWLHRRVRVSVVCAFAGVRLSGYVRENVRAWKGVCVGGRADGWGVPCGVAGCFALGMRLV